MDRVVVLGGGVVGLACALLLARDGADVTVLERDLHDRPPEPRRAWAQWRRPGVPQFRQPHNLFPRFQQVLDADLADLPERLVDAGCGWRDPLSEQPPSITDQRPRPGDERFRSLTGRRPVVEAVFAGAVREQPGVRVLRGTPAAGLVVDERAPLHVRGVRTTDGGEHLADLVVDASGRGSPVAAWLAELGAAPVVEQVDQGFAYYSRYFRGDYPGLRAPGLSPLGSFSLLTVPGDADTWSVTVFGTSQDRLLKQVRDVDAFSRVVRACPLHAHWLDGEPISDVLPMAGVLDRYRRFVVRGVPVVTGLAAVGDAWACTNPSAGRGLSVGLAHAQLLRDAVRRHDVADDAFAVDWDACTERVVAPFFRAQVEADTLRIAEMVAHRDGRPPPATSPREARFLTAAAQDPAVFRALLDVVLCLAHADEVLARPDVAAAVERLGADTVPALPGPTRPQLADLLA